jgi:hypothetical protein
MIFYEMKDHTLSTFDKHQVSKYQEEGLEIKSQSNVLIIGINEFINTHVNKQNIDFLNLDVEGLDSEIIENFDFGYISPNVICLETCEWSMRGIGMQNDTLIKTLLDHDYYVYANTHFNSIFVKNGF